MAAFESPQVLVLGGGGILGEAWMTAVLAGLADASGVDPRDSEAFVGTSAGAIVATALSAGIEPGARLELPEQPPVAAAEVARDGGLPARALNLAFTAAVVPRRHWPCSDCARRRPVGRCCERPPSAACRRGGARSTGSGASSSGPAHAGTVASR